MFYDYDADRKKERPLSSLLRSHDVVIVAS